MKDKREKGRSNKQQQQQQQSNNYSEFLLIILVLLIIVIIVTLFTLNCLCLSTQILCALKTKEKPTKRTIYSAKEK